jgi:glycosyltransferase involved in cell wall biosynthesis
LMRICFIADARSPIAENWILYFVFHGHDVAVISTYPCAGDRYPNVSVSEVTSKLGRRAETNRNGGAPKRWSRWAAQIRYGPFADLSFRIQHRLEQFEVPGRTEIIRELLRQIKPELVHAMRLPFEGIMAARADPPAPLLISIWGNDLTLFAAKFPWTRRESQRALWRADALHCDCQRDLKLAGQIGFDLQKPSIVLPGGGGIQTDVFGEHSRDPLAMRRRFNIPEHAPLVCNPRGFRAYVRNEAFFRAIALTAEKRPEIVFAAVAMQGHPIAECWVSSLRIQQNVRLLPALSRYEMAELLRSSDIMVSPSEHDGTPNTLLESMAAGAFPIAGDIESVREWITDGFNGRLPLPTDPRQLSEAILAAISNAEWRHSAAAINRHLIEERAEYTSCMKKAEEFYQQVAQNTAMKLASGF